MIDYPKLYFPIKISPPPRKKNNPLIHVNLFEQSLYEL